MQSDEQERPLHRMCQTLQSKIGAVLNGQAKDVNFYSVDDIQYEVCMIPYNESLQVREKKVTEVGNGLCGDTAASGAVSRVPNTCKDERFNLNSDLATITVSNMPSLWVPIRNLHGHIVGVVAVFVESDNAFDGGAGANVLRICHEIGPYFGDLIFIDALETERQRWREVTRQILTVFDNPEMDTCVEHVKAAFQRIFHLGRTQQWLFDASTANLTYTPAKGGGKDVTVSVNHPHPVCKCARSGTIWVIPPAYIEDNDVGARKDLYALPGSANEAQMIVPLMDSRNKPILIIQAERKHAFTSVEQEMMTEMSQIGALALEHARMLETESVPSVKQFEEALVLALTVEDAMREVIAACHKTCQCTNAVLFWPGPDGSMCQYYSEAGQVKMKTFVAAVGIASECLAEQKPMLLSDSRLHNRFHAGMDGLQYDQEERHDTHASAPEPIQAIYYPVVLKQSREPIAVICVREKKRGMAFNRQDLVSLGVLARKAAMTLRNVEKHEGLLEIARSRDLRHEQMANLNSIRIMQMEALASVSDHSPLNDIVKRMGNVICELLDVELCKLHVVEDGGKTLRMLGDSCFQDVVTDVTKAPESDIACRVLRDNETILFDLNSLGIEDPGVHLEVENVEMRDSLTVPLRGDAEQVFGVLQLVNKRGGSFTGSDELVIHMAASTFKTMLETYMLTEARFSIGLGNVESKPEEIAKIVLDKALHLMGVSVGQVLVLSDDQSKLKRYAAIMPSGERVGLSKRTFAAQRCEDENMYDATQGIAGHVLQTRATLNIPLLREESRFDAGIDLRNDFDGLHACLYCPMVTSSDDCIGVIQLVKASQGEFTEHKVRLLQVLAKQAGMMIWNRQRYESISRSSLQHVVDVTESVMWCLEVQPSIDLLVNRMTESVINIVPCENVVLLFCSRNGYKNHVWTKIANNTEDVWPFKKRTSRTAFSGKQPHTDVKIPLLNGILAEAIKTRKAVQAQRPDPQLTLDFEPLAVSEVPSQVCLSCVYVSGYVSLHLSMRQRKTARRHLFVHTGCMCCHLPC
jgi:transcriptional regulator with GAF, ATPase, and Fis domain